MENRDVVVKQIVLGVYKDSFIFEPDDSPVKDVPKLPAGIYELGDVGGMFGTKTVYRPIRPTEKYVDITGGTVGEVLKRADEFFSSAIKEKYAELEIAHKTGFILYGIPGTGKTVTSHIIMRKIAEKYDAICIVITRNIKPSAWRAAITEIQPLNRPVIFFCDECEEILETQEISWLTFLDGHDSITNFMFIGCTNYIHRISKRMKRPSRIEHLIEVKSIEEEVAKVYVKEKLSKLDSNTQAAIVHFAMEHGATIDSFKNAIKEFYIYSEHQSPESFEKILKSYIREEVGVAASDNEED